MGLPEEQQGLELLWGWKLQQHGPFPFQPPQRFVIPSGCKRRWDIVGWE